MAAVESSMTRALCAAICILMLTSSALSELVFVNQLLVYIPPNCTRQKCIAQCLRINRNPTILTQGECKSPTVCHCKFYKERSPPPLSRSPSPPTLE
ncbi:unnamed protein product [Urochloa decumbens]|uniref:Uncharacterized protein n=1 Tax=Urochloa decumbens TaxID=240449 RepID=A0ABC9AQB3_9POAL